MVGEWRRITQSLLHALIHVNTYRTPLIPQVEACAALVAVVPVAAEEQDDEQADDAAECWQLGGAQETGQPEAAGPQGTVLEAKD